MKSRDIGSALKEAKNMNEKKEVITLYPGMAGLSRETIKKMQGEGVELLSVDFMVTQKCNFRCSYCYASSSPEALHELTMKECKDLTQQCIDLKVRIININGGEPLYWNPSDWDGKAGEAYFYLLEYIIKSYKECNLPLNLVSFTNVSLINDEKAQRLFDMGVSLCCKLDTLNPQIQNELLGVEKGFELMSKGYTSLIKAGYGKTKNPSISTNTVVTPLNYSELENVYRWSRGNGFKPFIVPVHVHGTQQKNGYSALDRTIKSGKTNLSPLDIKDLFERLAKIDRNEFGIMWYAKMPWIENKACSRHLGGIHVRADGIVVPCSEAPDYWALGDIREKSLKEIIRNPIVKKFRNVYSNLHGSCSVENCEMSKKQLCYGCRTRAYDDSAYDDDGNYDVNKLNPDAFFGGDPACWRGLKDKRE